MNKSIKNTLTAIVALGTSVSLPYQAVAAAKSDTKQIRNEVGIMLNILQASLRQQGSNNNVRFRTDSVFYLANQGVVFEIDGGSRGGSFFGFDLQGLLNHIPVTPTAPNNLGASDSHFIDASEIEAIVERIVQHGDDYNDDLRDNLRDLSEEKRELAWEKREYERSLRDLEFAKRNADSERKEELETEIAKLDKALAKVQSKSEQLNKYREELEAQYQKEKAVRSAAKEKLYAESLAMFEDTVGDMLCSYGAGLKSLPLAENVTFLLTDFIQAEDDKGMGTQDKVYVFKYTDVKSCVTGAIDKEQLLASANTYLF
ncbi:hypothetical protein [Paraglaciecola sp. 2405UD69-4]|uniref:hypothetical protein n=1 Tax=Paraglaciecola sp. 2405UD69-4 TaxID=3391836 RepID=UPI0039C9D8F7